MLNKKKYIIGVFIVVILFAVGLYFFQNSRADQVSAQPKIETQTATSTSVWLTYHDPKYHFRIDYPSDLTVLADDAGVSFNEGESGPWMSGVSVRPTSYKTPDEVVAAEMQFENQTTIIDRPITIAGYSGILVHDIVEGFDHPLPQDVMFIKDGYLFTISDRSVDYQRKWDSFHFEE